MSLFRESALFPGFSFDTNHRRSNEGIGEIEQINRSQKVQFERLLNGANVTLFVAMRGGRMREKEGQVLRKVVEYKRLLIVASAWRLRQGWLWYCHIEGFGMIQREGALANDSKTALDTAVTQAQKRIDLIRFERLSTRNCRDWKI